MDRYAVIGNPVEHSQSPFIHACFAAQTGEQLSYERLLSPLDGFEAVTRQFAAGGAKGCNITVPFKFEAYALAPRRSARAQLAGAANLLRFDAQGWLADNTDGIGLVRDIQDNQGLSLRDKRVLMLGAGGAAAGALGPLLEARPAELVLANRTLAKAEALRATHADWASRHGVPLHARPLDDCGQRFDVLINATASSIAGAEVPVSPAVLAAGALALDMMYGAKAQGFLDWAGRHGAIARDGLGMLVEQAAEAFFIWRGVRPLTPKVLTALRQRLGLPA
jgi:shikimate dehydrogenase